MTGISAEQQARDLLEQCGVEDAQSFTAGDVVALANFIAEASRCRRQLAAIRALSDSSTEFDGRGCIYVYAEDLDKILDGAVAAGLGKPPPKPTAPSFDPAWDKSPDEIARIQANPNPSRLGKPQ